MQELKATVKKYGLGANKSYGFIVPEGGGEDVFVHKSKLAAGVETLEENQRVVFLLRRGMKGPEAHDVKPE